MPQWELEPTSFPRVGTLRNGTRQMSQNYPSFKVRELEYLYIKSQESMIEDYSSEGAKCLLFFPLLAYSIWAKWVSMVVAGVMGGRKNLRAKTQILANRNSGKDTEFSRDTVRTLQHSLHFVY